MTYEIIATGSSGNATLINDKILVDCGVPWNKIEPYSNKIKLVLLTHEHTDHFKKSTVNKLHAEHPTIRWGCCEWMVPLLLDAGVDKRVIDIMSPYKESDDARLYKKLAIVHPDFIPHNVPNCAWHIFDGEKHIFYATDCATLDDIEAKNYDLYFIENNHSKEEIKARMKEKRKNGEYAYEWEAMHNHLSEEQAMDWLAKNAGSKSRYVFLHQHKEK